MCYIDIMDKAPPQLLSVAGRETSPASRDAVLRCQAALLSRRPLADAATALAAELAEILRCRRVSVGLLQDERIVIAGSSQTGEIDPRLEAGAAIAAAMHESLDQSQTVRWPPLEAHPHVTLAHRQLAGAAEACSVPIVASGQAIGALTVESDSGTPLTLVEIALCEEVASFSGPVLAMKQDAEAPWRARWRNALRERLATREKRHLAIGTALAALLLALAAPLPWRVSAPARLEGSVQRAIVAAADGFLQQTNVRPGDHVKAGQVLARLSSQDLELERRRRESELRQHENGYRAAQARNDRTQMVVSQSRAAEAQALLTLAETQLERSQLTAPFDGIVIKGDLTQNLGAPVHKGEVLMVLSASDGFRLIVEVDETDIGAVHPGQPGQLALAARPEKPLRFTTKRIVPVATAADGRNYFEVEGVLDERQSDLRPGLSGIAKIEVGQRSIAWLLFHRAASWLRLALWTLAP
jgi:RND family efflux transporter MFP subunit